MQQRKNILINNPSINNKDAFLQFTLSATIKRFTTDSNGTILNDAIVPINQRKAYPFHLFGEYDRVSGYALSDMILSEQSDTILFSVYTVGLNTPLFFFSPFNTINNQLKKGDIVFIYVDDINAPNYFHFVIVSATQGGFASITNISNVTQLDSEHNWGAFKFFDFTYVWQNDEQLNHSIYHVVTNYKNAFKADPINPAAYQYTQLKPGVRSITIPVEMIINQYNGLSSFIAWENPLLTLNFNIYF